MNSCLVCFDMQVSGKITADRTVLFTDFFDLFPGTFGQLTAYFEQNNRVVNYSDAGFTEDKGFTQLRHKTLNGYADDLICYLESKQISNITYMAHSVNAMIAFTAAIKAPHLFSRLVLTSAFASLQPDSETHYLCGLQEHNPESVFNYLIKKDNFAPHTYQDAVQLTDILKNAFANMNEDEAKSLFTLLLGADCRSFLGNITVPAIILQVASDHISTNEAGYFMYRTIPDSQLIRIKAKGQMPQTNAPQEIVQAMQFLISSPL